LARLLCGRCGHRTEENSIYCPNCKWTLYVDRPESEKAGAVADVSFRLPEATESFLGRRRLEKRRAGLDKTISTTLKGELERLEKQVESEEANFEVQRALGEVAYMSGSWERSIAHLNRAHQLNPDDLESQLNLALVMAQRNQLLNALDLLQKAYNKWPKNPLVLYNLGLVAQQAGRAKTSLQAIAVLEKLWQDDPDIADEYHDDAMTIRGLAYLLQNQATEAVAALHGAATHSYALHKMEEEEKEDALNAFEVLSDHPEDEEEIPVAERQLTGKAADADVLNNLAMAEAAMGELPQAVSRLFAALRIDPSHTRVLNNLGVLAYEQGKLEDALKFLQTAFNIEEALGEHESFTNNHMGVVLSAMGRLDEGMEKFMRAGTGDMAQFEAYYNLGRAYVEHGKPELGIEHLRQSHKLNPYNADVLVVAGVAFLLRGKSDFYPHAITNFRNALKLDPRHRVAYADMAQTLVEMNRENDAIKVITQALKVNPKSPETIFLLASLIMLRGSESHWVSANEQFATALQARPDMIAAVYNSAMCQYLLGFRESAADLFQVVVQQDPAISPAYYLIGVGHAMGKRYDEALAAWHRALKFEPRSIDLLANIAFAYYKKNEWKQSIKYFQLAHDIDRQDPTLLSGLGLSYARAKMFDRAIESFQKSLQIDPHAASTHSNLGLSYYLAKEVEQAIKHWRLVSQLDASYAKKMEQQEERSFDDSMVDLRPLDWQNRLVRMAPSLPKPRTKLVPGFNMRRRRFLISDPKLQDIYAKKQELDRLNRRYAFLHKA